MPAKGGDLDDIASGADMHDLEASSYYARATKQCVDLFRTCIRGYVEILRFIAQQQVAHASADEIRFKPCLAQSPVDRQCFGTD
jgi:hypothetical protein